MEINSGQTYKNPKKSPPFAPKAKFLENPYKSANLWKRFSHIVFAFLLSYLAFLFFTSISPHSTLPKPYLESYLNKITDISMELTKNTIQASSLHNKVLPLLISRKIQDIPPPSEASVDLLLVFDFLADPYWSHREQTEQVRHLLKTVLPSMNSQDRISFVFLDSLAPNGHVLSILPFANITKNPQEILSAIGADILRGNTSRIKGGVKTVLNLLNQRKGANQTTGVFFFTKIYEKSSEGLNFFKQYFGLEETQSAIIRTFTTQYIELGKALENNLKELRAGVLKTYFVIKPEESDVLKGVKVLSKTHSENAGVEWLEWLLRENRPFLISAQDFKLGLQEEFLFYLRIMGVTKIKNATKVKAASCQQIYLLVDGSKMVKNFDLIVKITGEGEEELVEEEKSWKALKEFKRKWEEDWLVSPVIVFDKDVNYRYFREEQTRIWRI